MTLLPLIEKLKAAKEPSRELDQAVADCVGFMLRVPSEFRHELIPEYTTSIDAATSLLRKHYYWVMRCANEAHAVVWWKEHGELKTPSAKQLPEYPALALTTAILIARAVEDREISL